MALNPSNSSNLKQLALKGLNSSDDTPSVTYLVFVYLCTVLCISCVSACMANKRVHIVQFYLQSSHFHTDPNRHLLLLSWYF